jgi:hypothetical protein
MQGQVQVKVCGADMRRDTGRNLRDKQGGHRSADDREMTAAERAPERSQDVSCDSEQATAHRVVVVACPGLVIWHE